MCRGRRSMFTTLTRVMDDHFHTLPATAVLSVVNCICSLYHCSAPYRRHGSITETGSCLLLQVWARHLAIFLLLALLVVCIVELPPKTTWTLFKCCYLKASGVSRLNHTMYMNRQRSRTPRDDNCPRREIGRAAGRGRV